MKIRFEIYPGGREGNEQWYWRARAVDKLGRAGRTVADGAEGYYKLGNARRAVNRFLLLLGSPEYEIVVVD